MSNGQHDGDLRRMYRTPVRVFMANLSRARFREKELADRLAPTTKVALCPILAFPE